MRPLSFPTYQHIPPFKKPSMEISGKCLHSYLHLIRAYKSCRFMLCMVRHRFNAGLCFYKS
ncbi:hypothetical protein Hanom_Chr05g00395441 [Helianthus anomalus]